MCGYSAYQEISSCINYCCRSTGHFLLDIAQFLCCLMVTIIIKLLSEFFLQLIHFFCMHITCNVRQPKIYLHMHEAHMELLLSVQLGHVELISVLSCTITCACVKNLLRYLLVFIMPTTLRAVPPYNISRLLMWSIESLLDCYICHY